MTLEDRIESTRARFQAQPPGRRKAYAAALRLAEIEDRHDAEFIHFLETMDEERWDAYIIELGWAFWHLKAARSLGMMAEEMCEGTQLHEGCGCRYCGLQRGARAWAMEAPLGDYQPMRASGVALRFGHDRHNACLLRALGE